MIFEEMPSNATTDSLLNILDRNSKKAKEVRKDIEKLKIKNPSKEVANIEKIVKSSSSSVSSTFLKMLEKCEFLDEVDFFLNEYRNLKDDFALEDLLEVLPSRKDKNFKRVINRLQAESVREIKEIYEIINTESEDLSQDELAEFREDIFKEEKKISLLKEVADSKEKIISEEDITTNKIVLVPTLSGNIRIIDDIEHLPKDFNYLFLGLINSIIDGTFKGVKRFTTSLVGACEVRDFPVRIMFARIDKNTYALITAIVKKADNDKRYQENLKRIIGEYKKLENSLKKNIENAEFMKNNNLYVLELFKLLGDRDKAKKYIRGGLND